jgi:hypothetical protein
MAASFSRRRAVSKIRWQFRKRCGAAILEPRTAPAHLQELRLPVLELAPTKSPVSQIVHYPDLEPCSCSCRLYVAAPAKIMPEKKTPNSPKLASSKPLSCNSIDERCRS